MTLSAPVYPGTTYFITRRCEQGSFHMKPGDDVNQTIEYSLITNANRYQMLLHFVEVLSNHYHLILTDPFARLPRFIGRLNSTITRSLNTLYDRSENIFNTKRYSRPALESVEDFLEKSVYTLTNCVQAGLVEKSTDWPGIRYGPLEKVEAIRPSFFFRDRETQPEKVELQTTKPPMLEHLGDKEYCTLINELVAQREAEIAAEFNSTGRVFLGAEGVLAQPREKKAPPPKPARSLNPRIVARCKKLRKKLMARMRSFLEEYKEALKRFCSGERDVEFPAGTWLMRVRYNVRCAEP